MKFNATDPELAAFFGSQTREMLASTAFRIPAYACNDTTDCITEIEECKARRLVSRKRNVVKRTYSYTIDDFYVNSVFICRVIDRNCRSLVLYDLKMSHHVILHYQFRPSGKFFFQCHYVILLEIFSGKYIRYKIILEMKKIIFVIYNDTFNFLCFFSAACYKFPIFLSL